MSCDSDQQIRATFLIKMSVKYLFESEKNVNFSPTVEKLYSKLSKSYLAMHFVQKTTIRCTNKKNNNKKFAFDIGCLTKNEKKENRRRGKLKV